MKTLDAGNYDCGKLTEYGFVFDGGAYALNKPLDCGMELRVRVGDQVLAGVFDGDEEYTLIFTDAEGGFVGKVRGEFEREISALTTACFDRPVFTNVFSGRQTKLAIETAKACGEELEFLWDDSPDCAIVRRADSEKWYAVFMKVALSKFFPGAEGTTEIINLHVGAEIADGKLIFPAFHMNKKLWISVLTDRGLPDEKLLELLLLSRENSAKKSKRRTTK